jgi:hypothetical protein
MDPLLTLERFAALSAEIEAGAPPDAILAREGLSPEQWAAFEAMWRARIEDDISHGSFELTNRYNASFVARRAALRYETPAPDLMAGGYAAEASMQPVPTPRMLQAPPPGMAPGDVGPPPTPRMLQAPPPPAMMSPADPGPPPTPRMLQAPPPLPPAMVVDQGPPPVPTPRMVQAPPPVPRTAPSYPSLAAPVASPEPARPAYDVEDSPTPVPETLRPGMALPVTAGDRPTPPPSTQENRTTAPEEMPPPSSRPASTPRQETQEGPRFDGLPFRPGPAGSDVAPRSTGDFSGVLPFKPAAGPVSVAAPAPAPAPAPQSPWGGTGTGTVKMGVVAGPPPIADPETEITGPISPPPAAPFVMQAVAGPPVLTNPGSLTPSPVPFPFALRRRASDPQAFVAPAHASPPHAVPASPPALPAHALPPHSVPSHALPAHLAQAQQAAPQIHVPQARPSQPAFPAVNPAAPPASPPGLPPMNLPPPPVIATAGPSSTHLAPVSSRQTLPPNLAASSPVVPFKAAPDAPGTYSAATAAGFPPPTPYNAPAAAPAPQPAGLAVPAVLGASSSRLTLEQYASLSAEIAISPGISAAVRARYGLDENAYVAETGLWQRRFSSDKELFIRYSALYQSYREWFSRAAR